MTTQQQQLIDTLAARNITASFNGDFLNGHAYITRKGKQKKQSFGIKFDDASTLEGPAVTRNLRGTYAESFARDAFFEALFAVDENEAAKYHAECKEVGIRSGAPQAWIDALTTA